MNLALDLVGWRNVQRQAREKRVTRGGFERAGKAEFELLTGRYEVNRDTCSRRVEKKTRKEQ
jgi:hypothetical protein